ncbi:GyrI-like domain-containing protein [Clostridium sp. YIM B02515]|uniref:GyrI-like domain-containing protein n=1 Tax=Clostridium rhizosphaerae TaxID=2803861 RepID=A0ABS1TAM6_9CLOT|nr:GyrI-like domain-containing protein [Clostridium rhizosphaerae]MBL4935063.1 GyrI-like domain-containing protein [Clostridium rhizosphaerae]
MGELIKLEVKKLPRLKLIGKELRYNMEVHMKGDNRIPSFWDKCFADNTFSPLENQPDFVYDNSYVGVMLDWDKGDGDFSYIVAMLMKDGVSVPDGYFCRDIEETDVAIGWIKGKNTADVCSIAHSLTEQALKKKGYKCDKMKWFTELYNCPRFTTPDENGDIILDYYIPIDAY